MNGDEINLTAIHRAPSMGLDAGRGNWIALNKWLEQMGTSSVTAWRWRKRGWLKVVNVGGRLFLRPEDRAEFERRAVAGEFAKTSSLAGAPKGRSPTGKGGF